MGDVLEELMLLKEDYNDLCYKFDKITDVINELEDNLNYNSSSYSNELKKELNKILIKLKESI